MTHTMHRLALHNTHKLNLNCYHCRAHVARRVARSRAYHLINAHDFNRDDACHVRETAYVMRHVYRLVIDALNPTPWARATTRRLH